MTPKIRNSKRRLNAQPRYLTELRMDIEIDQGHPLTTAQDVTLKKMLADASVTVGQVAERLVALRPKPRT